MSVRIGAWVAVVGLAVWGLADQLNRYMGSPGGPTFDLSVSNAVALATFGVAIAVAVGLAISKPGRLRPLLAIALVMMMGPLWLSTRHIYVNDKDVVIERGLFLDRQIHGVDPEARCFVQRGGTMVAIDRDGRELGRVFEGIFPWTLHDSEFFDVLSAGCRQR